MITLALSNGLKVSKPLLMRCLDEQVRSGLSSTQQLY